MVDDPARGLFQCVDEGANGVLLCLKVVLVGHDDQAVMHRDTQCLGRHGAGSDAEVGELSRQGQCRAADEGIDPAFVHRAYHAEVHVLGLDMGQVQSFVLKDGPEQDVLSRALRVADPVIDQSQHRVDVRIFAYQQRRQWQFAQGGNPDDGAPLVHQPVQGELVGQCQIRLGCRHQLGRYVGIGGGLQHDVQSAPREQPPLLSHQQGCVLRPG